MNFKLKFLLTNKTKLNIRMNFAIILLVDIILVVISVEAQSFKQKNFLINIRIYLIW